VHLESSSTYCTALNVCLYSVFVVVNNKFASWWVCCIAGSQEVKHVNWFRVLNQI